MRTKTNNSNENWSRTLRVHYDIVRKGKLGWVGKSLNEIDSLEDNR